MISIATVIMIAVAMFALAVFKGRTGWHWLVLSLIAFASFWFLTAVALHFSDIRISIHTADRELALFAGSVTAAVMAIILFAVPSRPRPRWRERRPAAGPDRGAFLGRHPRS